MPKSGEITTLEYTLQITERERESSYKVRANFKTPTSSGLTHSLLPKGSSGLAGGKKSLCLHLHRSREEESEQAVKSLPTEESESHLQLDQPFLTSQESDLKVPNKSN